jgi:hypothetical protein
MPCSPFFANRALAEPGDLYQIHGPNVSGTEGRVFKFTGTPCSDAGCPGWKLIDTAKHLYSVKATGGVLYGIEAGTNFIWQYNDQPAGCPTQDTCPGWTEIDANSQTKRTIHLRGQAVSASRRRKRVGIHRNALWRRGLSRMEVSVQEHEQPDRREWRILRDDKRSL